MKKFFIWTLVIISMVGYVSYAFLEQAGSCDSLEEEVKRLIEESQFCSQDSDCTFMSFNCPFGCLTTMNSAAKSAIMSGIKEYHGSCMPMCPDCPKGAVPVVRCEVNRCVVAQ